MVLPDVTVRFAPGPNGPLHLGHAYSALLNFQFARASGGRFLIRMEDIDTFRCSREIGQAQLEDLARIGLCADEDVLWQSEHVARYGEALRRLDGMGLLYPAFLSRKEISDIVQDAEASGETWPRDPDGVPHFPPVDRQRRVHERQALVESGKPYALRLDMAKAIEMAGEPIFRKELTSLEKGACDVSLLCADPGAWGDVILARKDIGTSYHIAVVVDDHQQGISHVIRGRDLFAATSVHRLLQVLLGLDEPIYHHHDLITDPKGDKLSKSTGSTSLADLIENRSSPEDILERLRVRT